MKLNILFSKIFLGIVFCSSLSQGTAQVGHYSIFPDYVVEDDSMYTYEMICEDLDFFATHFPDWVHPLSIGKSEFGLDMKTIRIGREAEKKNSLFFVGNIHAREDYSSKFVMKFANVVLLNLSGQDNTYSGIEKLLDSVDLYILPVANPDGLKIAHNNLVGIQDSFNLYKDSIILVETYSEWKANGKGIDLNTSFDDGNHAVKKGDTYHTQKASEGYKGKLPAEPIETQNLQRFIRYKQPLFTASFHTKGNVIFWADAVTHPYFKDIDTRINLRATQVSGFKVAKVALNPATFGCGLENYVRARFGLLGSCVELSRPEKTRKQFADNEFNAQVWNLAWKIPYIYIEEVVKSGTELRQISINVQEKLRLQN